MGTDGSSMAGGSGDSTGSHGPSSAVPSRSGLWFGTAATSRAVARSDTSRSEPRPRIFKTATGRAGAWCRFGSWGSGPARFDRTGSVGPCDGGRMPTPCQIALWDQIGPIVSLRNKCVFRIGGPRIGGGARIRTGKIRDNREGFRWVTAARGCPHHAHRRPMGYRSRYARRRLAYFERGSLIVEY